ncbi:MAG: ClbS/DfsB family four-helix bundle protein [SAR202 cluster bacterium]|nr:ClbS/DfsB family four-helix bundle protein [SAR202 cluster bacterium]
MTTRTKANILREIEDAREALMRLLEGVPEGRWEESNAEGTWSVRDVLGHIATWDEESVNRVRNFTSGRAPVPTPTNYNEREVERQRRLSAKAIKELFERNHTAAMRYLRSLPAEALRRADVEKQVMGCMANHYQEHAESLRNWVAKG